MICTSLGLGPCYNRFSFCVELNLGPALLTIDGETFSIIISITSLTWCIVVLCAYFKYLPANVGGRSHTNRGGNLECISLKIDR